MSYSWWVSKHNAHHAHPNDLETDPDVRAGALVFDADQADERRGFAGWVTGHQAALFVPMLLLEALNLHISSVREMFKPDLRGRAVESVLLAVHFLAYASLLVTTLTWAQALVFLAVHKGLQGIYLGMSFAPGHKGMPVLDGEQAADPLLRQVLTSRNIRGGLVLETALGGLNYQIEHHLFPSMPRPNLRRAQPVVREFCVSRGVAYTEASPFQSYAAGLRHLHVVGAGLRARART
jgi:fatty acid desaturase